MSTSPQTWTVLSLLEWTSRHLADKGFEESRLHVELLLAHVLRLKRLDLYLQFDRPLTPTELSQFRSLYERRLKHEPIQYILGETEFMGLRIEVARGALIPRPETELLVERALEIIREAGVTEPAILDIGCGSGNISVALARNLPTGTIVSMDREPEALALTRRNAELHGLGNIELVRLDILTETPEARRFDLIVSNPPYVPDGDMQGLQPEVRDYEPVEALTDGADGLTFYRRYAEILPAYLKPRASVLVEVGFGQAPRVSEIMSAAGFGTVLRHVDFAGIERVVEAVKEVKGSGIHGKTP